MRRALRPGRRRNLCALQKGTVPSAFARLVGSPVDGGRGRQPRVLRVPASRGVRTRRTFEPQDPEYESRIRSSFARQTFMTTIGARLSRVVPGEVDIELPVRDDLAQQHGFLHAGVLASAADSACGYAAFSLMPPAAAVLSVEFKINLLAPAVGDRVVASGRVIRAGRNVSVCWGEVTAYAGDAERLVATMVATMMTVRDSGLTD